MRLSKTVLHRGWSRTARGYRLIVTRDGWLNMEFNSDGGVAADALLFEGDGVVVGL